MKPKTNGIIKALKCHSKEAGMKNHQTRCENLTFVESSGLNNTWFGYSYAGRSLRIHPTRVPPPNAELPG